MFELWSYWYGSAGTTAAKKLHYLGTVTYKLSFNKSSDKFTSAISAHVLLVHVVSVFIVGNVKFIHLFLHIQA